MKVDLPAHLVNRRGQTVFTALVAVEDDGALQVLVPLPERERAADEGEWMVAVLDCAIARSIGGELKAVSASLEAKPAREGLLARVWRMCRETW